MRAVSALSPEFVRLRVCKGGALFDEGLHLCTSTQLCELDDNVKMF